VKSGLDRTMASSCVESESISKLCDLETCFRARTHRFKRSKSAAAPVELMTRGRHGIIQAGVDLSNLLMVCLEWEAIEGTYELN